MAKQVTAGQIRRFIEREIATKSAAAKEATDIKVARIALRGTILAAVVGVLAGVATPIVQTALKNPALEKAEVRKAVNEALKEKETTIILLQDRIGAVQRDLGRARADAQRLAVPGQPTPDIKEAGGSAAASLALDEALKKSQALAAQNVKLAKDEVDRLEKELARLEADLREAQSSVASAPDAPRDPAEAQRRLERIQQIRDEMGTVSRDLSTAREAVLERQALVDKFQPAPSGSPTGEAKPK
jgi:DNA repair exonuclease SbcCD ATPase subunit